jgi:multiple sugar transport system substrate-binding protein
MAASAYIAGVALAFACMPVPAGTLIVNLNSTDPAPRAAWESVVRRFEQQQPDVRVQLNLYDHESYKKSIRNWLTGMPPDVVFWFAGYRMRQFVTPGLLEDVSDLYSADVRRDLHRSALDLVSVGDRQYGVPYTYYQIGLYVRRDVLLAAGLPYAPRTWPDLLFACERLRASGVAPIAIGTKELWPAAAWFDYIDLRVNGLAFHRELMEGRVRYTDSRVRAVFAYWRELLGRNCFSANHTSSTWQEAQPLLYQGRAAMMLSGNYIVANFPPETRPLVDFAPFPIVSADVGRFEEAPMNTLHVPARARNKDDARRFLAFVLRADVQEELNRTLLQLPVNTRARAAADRYLEQGRALLAGADGLAQFFDRDTSEDLAVVAMKGFQEFMVYPDRLDAILDAIESARARIYGALLPTAPAAPR